MSHQGYYTGNSNFENVNDLLNEAELYRDQSFGYSEAAAASASTAATSASSALTSANNASLSEATVASDAASASTSASAAISASTAAQASQTAAALSETAAAASALSASGSASSASNSATTASAASSSASTSASAASTSASNAAASASTASTAATNADTSATNAANSASAASTSASNASSSASSASSSATAAATSATNASNSASAAALSASNAASSAASLIGRNKIINGRMDVSRRGTSQAAAPNNSYLLDRWQFSNTSTGVCTISQQADAPTNSAFQSSLRAAVTTFDNALAAGDLATIQQKVEGYNVRDLVGVTFTLSFWVRSSKTGVHCVSFTNSGTDRSYVAEYTVSVANTWEYKTVTVVGGLISTGTWDFTTGIGLNVRWALMTGSTYRTTSDSWQSGNFAATANQVNCFDLNGNIFAITGVQLEVGTVATPFEHRPYGYELLLCERYFENAAYGENAAISFDGNVTSGSAYSARIRFTSVKRAVPTIVLSNAAAFNFPTTTGSTSSGTKGFFETRTANASGLGNFQSLWTASAEL